MPVAIINRKNIADWCSKDRKILVTPSYFVVRSSRYKGRIMLSALSLFIIAVCKKWSQNSGAFVSNVQVGDNWSLTSTLIHVISNIQPIINLRTDNNGTENSMYYFIYNIQCQYQQNKLSPLTILCK
jgi:hypothetical protein